MFEAFHAQALHQLQVIVGHPATLALEVRVVSSLPEKQAWIGPRKLS